MISLLGIKLIENRYMEDPIWKTEQSFVPKSKKKRIQKKARKLYTTTKIVGYKPWDRVAILGNHTMIGHPSIIRRLEKEIKEEEDGNERL